MEITSRRVETMCLFRQIVILLVFAFAVLLPLRGEDKPTVVANEATQRAPLSAGQMRAMSLLRQARPEQPAPLFLLNDPNKDPDDLSVLVETKYLQEHGSWISGVS